MTIVCMEHERPPHPERTPDLQRTTQSGAAATAEPLCAVAFVDRRPSGACLAGTVTRPGTRERPILRIFRCRQDGAAETGHPRRVVRHPPIPHPTRRSRGCPPALGGRTKHLHSTLGLHPTTQSGAAAGAEPLCVVAFPRRLARPHAVLEVGRVMWPADRAGGTRAWGPRSP